MGNDDTQLYKQLFIFSSIIFFVLSIAFVLKYYKGDFKKVAQSASAAANEAGKGFKELLTEDLSANIKKKKRH